MHLSLLFTCCLDRRSNIRVVANFAITRKRTWLFVNACERKSHISTVTELSNSCQDGTGASMCSAIML
jgi:hypothetical protein